MVEAAQGCWDFAFLLPGASRTPVTGVGAGGAARKLFLFFFFIALSQSMQLLMARQARMFASWVLAGRVVGSNCGRVRMLWADARDTLSLGALFYGLSPGAAYGTA